MAVFEKQVTSDRIQSGVTKSELITINSDPKHQAQMVKKNVDELYSDPKSWIRELVSNGLDATIGQQGVRVEINKKATSFFSDPVIEVKDYGTGMSQETVFGLYRYFGMSNRSNDKFSIGALN